MNNHVSVDALSSDSSKDDGVVMAGSARYDNKNGVSYFFIVIYCIPTLIKLKACCIVCAVCVIIFNLKFN